MNSFVVLIFISSFSFIAFGAEPPHISKKILKDAPAGFRSMKPDDQNLMNDIDSTKLEKKKKQKVIVPNSGQCEPGQTSNGASISNSGVEDFHCTSPAPLGPDLTHQRGFPKPQDRREIEDRK